jgi:hypothetical protein
MSDREPAPFVKGVRFGGGFVAGLVLVLLVGIVYVDSFNAAYWIIVGMVALAFGISAMSFGDDFWQRLVDWLRWWH